MPTLSMLLLDPSPGQTRALLLDSGWLQPRLATITVSEVINADRVAVTITPATGIGLILRLLGSWPVPNGPLALLATKSGERLRIELADRAIDAIAHVDMETVLVAAADDYPRHELMVERKPGADETCGQLSGPNLPTLSLRLRRD